MKIVETLLIILLIAAEIIFFNVNSYSQVTQEWAKRYNSQYNLNDIPVGIAVDKSGNSYVTGYSYTSTFPPIIATTIKYSSSGVQQWVRVYYDATLQENQPVDMALDTSGNIYITGYTGDINTGYYYTWLIKYNIYGDTVWINKYYGISYSAPKALTIDNKNNIYLTGGQQGGSYLIKYNLDGDSLWIRKEQEAGYANSIFNSLAVDTSGNIFAGGNAYTTSDYDDFLVVKYDISGSKLWSKTYGIFNKNEYARKIAIDRYSNIYITGTGYNPATLDYYDYLTIKYNSSGVQQWVRTYNSGVDEAYNIAVDYLDNVIITGSASSPGTGLNYCTIKYNPQGDSQWVRIYTGTGNLQDIAYYILVDSSNNIYVSGNSNVTGGGITTIKYTETGIQQWLINYPAIMQAAGGNVGQYLAIDRIGNIYILGYSNIYSTGDDFITVKYSQFVSILNINSETPDHYFLHQNYPNPFNPSTKIKFYIAPVGQRHAFDLQSQLVIYDMLGKEIAVFTPPLWGSGEGLGTFEVEWDGTDYPSGVYFYKLTAGDFSQAKKMILMK